MVEIMRVWNGLTALALGQVLILGLAGCAQFPELDKAPAAQGGGTAFPDLVPLESIARPEALPRLDAGSEADLQGRARGVKRRADTLVAAPDS